MPQMRFQTSKWNHSLKFYPIRMFRPSKFSVLWVLSLSAWGPKHFQNFFPKPIFSLIPTFRVNFTTIEIYFKGSAIQAKYIGLWEVSLPLNRSGPFSIGFYSGPRTMFWPSFIKIGPYLLELWWIHTENDANDTVPRRTFFRISK